MEVLVTGGAGFIGSHLAEFCLLRGDHVYIVDNLSTGDLSNIRHLQLEKKFKDRLFVHTGSVLNFDLMFELINTCDVVFHLAAAVGVKYILENPLESIRVNIQGTEMVLNLCSKLRKRVLLTSSSEVYGKHTHAPLVETDNVIYGPSSKFRWSYAASKLMDEFSALAYHRTTGLEAIVVRLFNTVGPKQTGAYGMVIPRFVSQALAGEPLTVYGDGLQSRTFTYVADVVNALTELMATDSAIGEVFNVGGTKEITINELAEKIIRMTGSQSTIQITPYDQAFAKDFEDMQRRVPGIEKIKHLIGFEPKTDLDTILIRVIEFVRQNTPDGARTPSN